MPDIRERIIEGSRPLFAQYGFRKLTMDQIAREMRISKRTIYEHFHSKDELIEAVCASFVDNDAVQLGIRLQNAQDCCAKMRALFKIYDIEGFGRAVFKRSEHEALKEFFPTAWNRFAQLIQSRRELIASVYREGVETGEFVSAYPTIPGSRAPLSTDETIELITFFASSIIDEALLQESMRYSIGLNTALQYVCDMVLNSITSR